MRCFAGRLVATVSRAGLRDSAPAVPSKGTTAYDHQLAWQRACRGRCPSRYSARSLARAAHIVTRPALGLLLGLVSRQTASTAALAYHRDAVGSAGGRSSSGLASAAHRVELPARRPSAPPSLIFGRACRSSQVIIFAPARDDAPLFHLGADHEARHVDEVEQRERGRRRRGMNCAALSAGPSRRQEHAALGLVATMPDDPPVDPREGRDAAYEELLDRPGAAVDELRGWLPRPGRTLFSPGGDDVVEAFAAAGSGARCDHGRLLASSGDVREVKRFGPRDGVPSSFSPARRRSRRRSSASSRRPSPPASPSPMTISAMRGEPRYMAFALPSTITTTSQKVGMYAPARRARPEEQAHLRICPESCTWLQKIRRRRGARGTSRPDP